MNRRKFLPTLGLGSYAWVAGASNFGAARPEPAPCSAISSVPARGGGLDQPGRRRAKVKPGLLRGRLPDRTETGVAYGEHCGALGAGVEGFHRISATLLPE